MGLVCELFVSGALTATFAINAGTQNPPERICHGAALTTAADSPIGTKVSSKLTENGADIQGSNVTVERLPDTDKKLISLKETLQGGATLERPIHPLALPMLKQQLAKDTTRSGP